MFLSFISLVYGKQVVASRNKLVDCLGETLLVTSLLLSVGYTDSHVELAVRARFPSETVKLSRLDRDHICVCMPHPWHSTVQTKYPWETMATDTEMSITSDGYCIFLFFILELQRVTFVQE
jgi:hypothetical protein